MTSAGGRIEIEIAPDLRAFPAKLQSGLKSASGLASTLGKGIGVALAAGTAVAAVGLGKALEIGIEYTSQLNTLQSVTQATGVQMAQVGNLAKQLGADMTLPATSAVDAAAAMTELAKGGLSVEQAMTAAKGTLQLAAAAQIDAARAAEIQSDALNQFGLAATEAGRVADILANTANAASGEVTDIASALKFVGPVAKAVNAPIESVATAIGLVATQGIRGEQAGTSLRGMIATLAGPSGPAAKALGELGVKAFDATGKFVGLRAITEQLTQAKGRMTDAAFAEAASIAFGNEGMTVASALASTGAKAFDDMAVSVQRAGGAADVAASKTKGLGGAWEGFKSQLETTGIEIVEAIDGPLEKVVRSGAKFVDEFGGNVAKGIENAVAAGEVFGPRLADAIRSRANVVGAAIKDVLGPVAQSSVGVLNAALNAGIAAWDDFTGVLNNAVDAAKPAARGIADIANASIEAGGPVSAVAAGIGLVGDAARLASGLLVPLGAVVGGIASLFAGLPGPIQSAVVALGLAAAMRGRLTSLGDAIKDRVTTSVAGFNEQLRLQQALLTGSTQIASQQVGRLGLAFAALEKNVPVIGRMAESFRNASTSAQTFVHNQTQLVSASAGISNQFTGLAGALGRSEGALRGLAGAAAGTAAALGTGLKAAAGGLISAFGGPWGVALAAAGVGLSLLASRQQEAAAKAAAHASHVDGLIAALRESNGVITESIRLNQAKTLQTTKLADSEQTFADAARNAGISLSDATDATLGNGKALDELRTKLEGVVAANRVVSEGDLMGGAGTVETLNAQGVAAQKLLDEINRLAGSFKDAEQKRQDLDRAIANGSASMLDATGSGRTLSASMKTLSSNTADADSRARALKDAMDALSGGNISLEASQARVQEVMARLRTEFQLTGDASQDAALKAKGWGAELVNAQGGLNLATENGRRLRDMLQDLSTNSAEAASKTFDLARAQGDDIPTAAAKASRALEEARAAAIAAATGMGIGSREAEILADRAGLIPSNVAMLVTTPGSDRTKIELALIRSLVDQVPPDKPITVRSLSDEAKRKLEDIGFTVRTLPDKTVQITANTNDAKAALDKFIRDNSGKVIGVRVQVGGIDSLRIGGPNAMNHDGNVIPAQRFAKGGLAAARPFKAGTAQIFPPRLLRYTGDRSVDDEYYIPDNNDPRSLGLLHDLAHRRGYELIRMFAQGGVAAGSGGSAAPMSLNGMAITGRLRVDMDGYATLIDARIQQGLDNTAREVQLRRGRTQ